MGDEEKLWAKTALSMHFITTFRDKKETEQLFLVGNVLLRLLTTKELVRKGQNELRL
jgi:hypothetical protein